jgi:hypothetical protein
MINVFVGWDSREVPAFEVAKYSLQRRSSQPVRFFPLVRKSLEWSGLYRRAFTEADGQLIDTIDGKPFSTEFSFSRFLTPLIAKKHGLTGKVLFVDCDFMFLDDVARLFDSEFNDPVAVVKHDFTPRNSHKMDGRAQQPYPCKLWSSLMLFNLDHLGWDKLTVDAVNERPGSWLHQFRWASSVGELDPAWNFIPGHSKGKPKAVHYTEGVPIFNGYEKKPWAAEWLLEQQCFEASIGKLSERGVTYDVV